MGKTAPAKLLFVECYAGIGGVEYSTLYLAQHLDPNKWNTSVIFPGEGPMLDTCREAGIPFEILKRRPFRSTSFKLRNSIFLPSVFAWFWNLSSILAATDQLAKYFRLKKPDLVVTKGLPSHFYGGLAARIAGIPCVWHHQDLISRRFFRLYERTFGTVSRFLPDQIVVDGEAIRRQLPPCVQSRTEVVLNGIDLDVYRPGIDGKQLRKELGIPSDALVVGNVARLTPWKGQHHLVEAFASIAAANSMAHLLLVGGPDSDTRDYEQQLIQQVAASQLREKVTFAGFRKDLPSVLAAIDVFAYTPVEKDTSPLSLLSAMAAGLPIVAFDIEGIREVLFKLGDGNLVTVGDIASLSSSISRVLSNERLRTKLATRSRRLAEETFGMECHTSRMELVFQKAIREANRTTCRG